MNSDTIVKEEAFHDEWARSADINIVMVDEFFEACTAPENRKILKYLADISGKKLLDLGCGLGESSVYFAKKGAEVTATDLSSEMLNFANKLAKKHSVKIKTIQSQATTINAENESFDIVYAANLLHHVDIDSTLKEVVRVLKKGGKFVSWDPLSHNIAINIYRKIASEVRTEDEHPLKMSDIKLFKKYFSRVSYSATWLFTLWIFIKFYFFEKANPNQVRYWKKIISEHKRLEKVYYRLEKYDHFVMKYLPFMKRYCWNIIIFAEK